MEHPDLIKENSLVKLLERYPDKDWNWKDVMYHLMLLKKMERQYSKLEYLCMEHKQIVIK